MKIMYKVILLLILIVSSSSCGNEQPKNIIGSGYVDFLIYVSAWDNELSVPTAHKTFPAGNSTNKGLGGLLAVSNPHKQIATGVWVLNVFDLACPYEKNKNVLLKVSNNLTAYCEKCKSIFNILDVNGSRESGPAETGLQVYRAIHQNDRPAGVFRVVR